MGSFFNLISSGIETPFDSTKSIISFFVLVFGTLLICRECDGALSITSTVFWEHLELIHCLSSQFHFLHEAWWRFFVHVRDELSIHSLKSYQHVALISHRGCQTKSHLLGLTPTPLYCWIFVLYSCFHFTDVSDSMIYWRLSDRWNVKPIVHRNDLKKIIITNSLTLTSCGCCEFCFSLKVRFGEFVPYM